MAGSGVVDTVGVCIGTTGFGISFSGISICSNFAIGFFFCRLGSIVVDVLNVSFI
jgi:hypothetical protein